MARRGCEEESEEKSNGSQGEHGKSQFKHFKINIVSKIGYAAIQISCIDYTVTDLTMLSSF